MRIKSLFQVAIFVSCGFVISARLSSYLNAQTQVNYSLQVARPPSFPRQTSVQPQPDGVKSYFGESGILRSATIPVDDSVIKPGPCGGTSDNLPFDLTQTGAPVVFISPKAAYFCVPDGTGQGFRLMRVEGAFTW